MLTDRQFELLLAPITDLMDEFQSSVIKDIARRIGNMSFASAAWQVQRINESGMVYEEILKKLSTLTSQSEITLHETFKKAGVQSVRFDDKIYTAAGFNPKPLNLSPAMVNVLSAGLRKTGDVLRNLTSTTALTGQNAFIDAADLAYMQVSTGTMSYTQAIREAIKKLASDGLSVIRYDGRQDQVDVAVRRTVLTGISQTVGELQITRADEMKQDLVQTSAHAGARPEHQVWQGKIFSRSGTNSKYPPFIESTGYGTVTGLCGVNCRHSFFPFFEGLSENAYNQAMLDDMADKTVVYHGKEISQYEASQIQRGIERKIRYWKRQEGALRICWD